MGTARQVAGFLRASWDRSLASVGLADLVVGIVAPVVGELMNVDLGLVAIGLVVAFLVVRVLLLSPAAMWHEARKPSPPTSSVIGSVAEGGTVNVYVQGDLVGGPATATAQVSRAAPRRRRRKADPPDQPPLPGF